MREKNAKKLEKKKKAKKITLNKITKKLKSQKSKKLKLEQDEKKLTSLVKNLMLKLKAEEKRRKAEKKDITDDKKVVDIKAYKINFAKLKKKLKLPVKGKVIYKYNSKRSDTGTRWKGLFIKAKEGSNVKSVAAGQIIFSDWLRGFGNIIIIDHGKNYMSLYGNNESLLKQKGDYIKGGEVIALSGNSGGNKYNGLYYELRHNGKPFNHSPIKCRSTHRSKFPNRCSYKKIPCHVPKFISLFLIEKDKFVCVSAVLICADISSGPSNVWLYALSPSITNLDRKFSRSYKTSES